MVLFDGEYWAAYLVKWSLKLAAAYVVALLVRRTGGSREGALFGATFFFFHPAPFELTLYMSDGLTALLMLLVAYNVLHRGPDGLYRVDLAGIAPFRYVSAFAAWLLLLGMKESAVALAGVFMLFWLIDPRGKFCRLRILPFAGSLLYAVVRVKSIAAGGIVLSTEPIIRKLRAYVDFVDPLAVGTLPGKFALLAILVMVVAAFRDRTARLFHSPLFLFLGLGGAYLAFISIPVKYPPWETPRYVVPIVAAVSVLVGAGLSRMVRRLPVVAIALTFFYSALTAGNIYTQHLAMNKQLDEFSVILNRFIDYEAQGYTALKMPASHPATEPDITVLRFLDLAGPRWYGQRPKAPVALDRPADWNGSGVLATREPPTAFLAGKFAPITKDDIMWIEAVDKTHLGGLEYLAAFWRKVSRQLGDYLAPRYDIGTLEVDSPPTWFLYGFRKGASASDIPARKSVAPDFGVLGDGSQLALDRSPGPPQVIEHSTRSYFSLTIPLKLGKGGWQLIPRGRLTVKAGAVYFGIGSGLPNTATHWNVRLESGTTYDPLPLPSVINSDGDAVTTAFLYAPAGPFVIEAAGLEDIDAIPVRMVRPTARFGAFIR
jgi:hypothetical protein